MPGAALICRVDVATHSLEAKRPFGFVPDSGTIYESLTSLEFLLMFGALYGIHENEARPRIQ